MDVSIKDSRLKAINALAATVPDNQVRVPGMRPNDGVSARSIITQLRAFPNLSVAGTANPQWRLHHWAPKKASSPWSIDISGQWRLLFEYDKKTHKITGLRLEQPH
ncbi:hypothetical protein [Sphingomonas sp. CFBP 8760]|uniref:hypothetical protein n=1 Tax=Sphingomonas sp. CFBP 8760 TaxID=2775282 RepID=UPI0017858F88|nr:hypothetical protein [Sphingomonas sp. CFBP 8760]MBD8548657.1 hypothetical protein [Sphingomonas sp. CFBP 8760]